MSGSQDAKFPSWDDARAEFDVSLAEPPVPESPQLQLLRELGVA